MSVAGLVLAAGAGRRSGGPKALRLRDDGTSWVAHACTVLAEAGCAPVVAVLGAAAEEARSLVPPGVASVVAEDWDEGMGASLRAGLAALTHTDADACLVHLVDLPDVDARVVARVLATLEDHPDPGTHLARAAYAGVPGHPVLLGRAHWPAITATARGDRGARDHLAAEAPRLVECGDLATGVDRDHG
ncbi:MAG: nucleotidyltransferase family protein [Nocardioides sp.]|nr:nucleotidyltransferase family protein [Nocardioides sp.]